VNAVPDRDLHATEVGLRDRDLRVTGRSGLLRGGVATVSAMRDRDVRAALYALLLRDHASELSSTLIVDELGLCGEVRVDVAVVNARLSGFELKSASDTLRRLPKQVEVYSRVLDYCTLVVAENHLDHAMAVAPGWWGVVAVRPGQDEVSLDEIKPPCLNRTIDAFSLAQLLWREEALIALDGLGAARGCRNKARRFIWQRLVDTSDLDTLRSIVRTTLKARQRWRADTTSARFGQELLAGGATC
jgi:hypothetical protein